MLHPGQRVHFVGIGGAGMSAIARVMLQQGYRLSGSDLQSNVLTAALAQEGVTVYQGHDAANLGDAEMVVVSSAIPPHNVEVAAARALLLPVYKRADILGALMQDYMGVAVAGTHGKTTTTAMIVHILAENAMDPTYIVGGVVASTGTNAKVGQGRFFVIEADEYDHMFLGLRPKVSVLTNVEHDHPDLFPTINDLLYDFHQFVTLLPPDGLLVVCADNAHAYSLSSIRREFGWPTRSYAINKREADWQAAEIQTNSLGGMNFTLRCDRGRSELGRGVLRVPGLHNVENALAALIVCDHLGVPLPDALASLATFTGAKRRFEIMGTAGGVAVIDDYAHHPTAITATLEAARTRYPQAGLWAVWQPHTFSRFQTLFDDFAAALSSSPADHILITDIYAAREAKGDGPGVADLVKRVAHSDVRHVESFEAATEALAEGVKPGDVVLILSAGDASEIGHRLLAWLGA